MIFKFGLKIDLIREDLIIHIPSNEDLFLDFCKNDIVTPPEVAEEFHEHLPDSELYWIDECGHAAMMEHPEEFNEILDDWLSRKIE